MQDEESRIGRLRLFDSLLLARASPYSIDSLAYWPSAKLPIRQA